MAKLPIFGYAAAVLLSRYLLRQALWPTLLFPLLICVLIWGLQALRLGHHLVGSQLRLAGVAELFALSLPALLVFALPLGLAAALALTLLRNDTELQAMKAAGASPARLARGPLRLILAVALLAALLAGLVERPSSTALHGRLMRAAIEGALGKAEPKRFHRLGPLTLYFEQSKRRGAALEVQQLFIARGDDLLLARHGSLRIESAPVAVALRLFAGELHLASPGAPHERVRFARWEQRVPLPNDAATHFGFIYPSDSVVARALRFGLATLALGLLALTSGLLLPPPQGGWVALLAVVGHEAACWWLPLASAPVFSAATVVITASALARFGR